MKKKIMILFMMILLVLSFQTRNAVAKDEGGTKAVAQAELTFVIFDYEDGQGEWIPGLEECPVPSPYSEYGDSYWAGKKTYIVEDNELVIDLEMDPAYGVSYPGMPSDYYRLDRLNGKIYYDTSSEETLILLDFFKYPLLDFGEKHTDLLKAYSNENQIYNDRFLKMDLLYDFIPSKVCYDTLGSIMGYLEDSTDGGHLTDNDEHLWLLSRNSADADVSALIDEIGRYRVDDANYKYNSAQEGQTFYLLWYSYDLTTGDGQTWNQKSSKGPSFTFKRSIEDGGINYEALINAYYKPYASTVNWFERVTEEHEQSGSTFTEFDYAEVDGTKVNVTTESGSVVVTLDPADLNTLDLGEHELTVYFKDGLKVTTSFTIAEAVEPTPTPTPTPTPAYDIPKTGIE